MSYRAPVAEISHTLTSIAGMRELADSGIFPDLSVDLVDAVLEEAGRFASDVIAPLNAPGDAAAQSTSYVVQGASAGSNRSQTSQAVTIQVTVP